MNGAKGHAALQLSRDLDFQYKTAYVMSMKIREALAAESNGAKLAGEVEIDGGYFGGYVKPSNKRENRRDRRLAENQTGKRRVVVVMRERNGRSLPFVFKAEGQSIETIARHVAPGSIVHADEAVHWDVLHALYLTKRINHQDNYSDGEACTNQAESFFSRIEWVLARDPLVGVALTEKGNLRAFEYAGARSIYQPDLYVIYEILDHEIVVKVVGYDEARAPSAGYA